MRTLLPVRGPFDAEAALAALAAHAVPGVERTDLGAGTFTRLFPAPGGPVPATIGLRGGGLRLTLHDGDEAATGAVAAAVRRLLDLDTDPARIAAVLGSDPAVGPLVRLRPGLRILGHADGFEGAILTVLGQQVSLAAARTFAGRLVDAFGAVGPAGLRLFPGPETLAAAGPEAVRAAVGLTGARARTVHALAAACADGLRIEPGGDHALIRRRLLGLPGIGPWTVEYLAMRALRDPDAFPDGDLVLRRALGAGSVQEVRAAGRRWSPLRAYAVFHLWTGHAYLPPAPAQ
ncbi:3-methyladenine DNA glycosylase 2 [Arthrobacter sp. I2-34]|uniref:DNA-3-methyladenine glycosylase II n=1 Tax=Arthrobacter hankyongi TaxID=2904801 RepID=A0ABS9L9X8_9MICC|nr:AlkA N-terminal domain-containing protein [Arthrobacter hankyongi]MCG2623313.1 3-methyladenine DNA glycosylase 2 [Arthrobacter hankyongi]